MKTTHTSGWKTAQSRVRTKKKIKLATIILLVLVLVLVVGQAVHLTQNLFKPLEGPQRQFLWHGESTINLVFKNGQITLFSFDPNEGIIKLANIPPDTYIEAADGFGNWQIHSISQLRQDNPVLGDELLRKSLADFLGLPINGFLEFDGSFKEKDAAAIIQQLKQNPLILVGNKDLKTNLTPLELALLLKGVRGVRFDKIQSFNLESLNLLDNIRLSDGTWAKTIEPAKIDGFISNYFSDSRIIKEQATIAVFNATSIPGLAQKAARQITNMGGNVIITSNTDERENSFVSGQNGYTKKRLTQIFAPNCQESHKCDILEDTTLNSRAQINVVLGKEYLP